MSQFTPSAAGLDRDAMLFAAGRASARTSRGWIVLAAGLASTQVLSFVLLWPGTTTPADRFNLAVAERPPAPTTVEPQLSRPRVRTGIWSIRSGLLDAETANPPDDSVSLIESRPPLRASGPLPASLLN
jgi:hypothetical protein